ncbi:MAG TPA: hypothetical protein VNK48_10200 [Xanthobacteraceae bacterium]|nr:hypothetical protein [Xanthobacteraceae bacterium]
MYRTFAAAAALVTATACFSVQSSSASADIVVNNILSPFVTIQVIQPPRRVRPARFHTWSLHDPHYRAHCDYRWDPYWGEWRVHCHRRPLHGWHY